MKQNTMFTARFYYVRTKYIFASSDEVTQEGKLINFHQNILDSIPELKIYTDIC